MSLYLPEVASIGGGTGNFAILSPLKEFTPHITAVPAMVDDDQESSTGRLRDEMGTLPPGDVRQCLVALSNLPEAREMMTYRSRSGPHKTHPTGNIILSSEEERLGGDLQKAVDQLGEMLRITGQVAPVSLCNHRLSMRDGSMVILGEGDIEKHVIRNSNATVSLSPKAPINPRAAEAILRADVVVIAPGDIYGSWLAALCVDGMREAMNESGAKLALVANLMNKPGKTDNWHVVDEVHKIGEYIGEDRIDYVIYNNVPPTAALLKRYAGEGEYPVLTTRNRFKEIKARKLGARLISREIFVPAVNDTIKRSYIRHDGIEVGRKIMRLHYE